MVTCFFPSCSLKSRPFESVCERERYGVRKKCFWFVPCLFSYRHKQHGFSVLTPLEEDGGVRSLAEVAEAGRATLWCQVLDYSLTKAPEN